MEGDTDISSLESINVFTLVNISSECTLDAQAIILYLYAFWSNPLQSESGSIFKSMLIKLGPSARTSVQPITRTCDPSTAHHFENSGNCIELEICPSI